MKDLIFQSLFGEPQLEQVDFDTLRRRDRPNDYLACAPGYCIAKADREVPVFPVPVEKLEEEWLAMMEETPRVRIAGSRRPERFYDFEQRVAVFGFPDRIAVRFFEAGDGRSTLAVYSRSLYGYSDLGVNRRRVNSWLESFSRRFTPRTTSS